MQYKIYFHHIVETLPDIGDDEMPTGNQLLAEEDWSFLKNKNLEVKFLESYTVKERDNLEQLNFECLLNYEAESDEQAIKMVDKVLRKNGFEAVDVFYITKNIFNIGFVYAPTIYSRGV